MRHATTMFWFDPTVRVLETYRGFPIVAPFTVRRNTVGKHWCVFGTVHGPSANVICVALRDGREGSHSARAAYRTRREATAAMRQHCYS